MARSNRKTKAAKPKKKAGGKKSSSAPAGSGGNNTMIKVMKANDKNAVLGYYPNGAQASNACGRSSKDAVRNALDKKGDKKGNVGSDGLFKVARIENCTEPVGPTELGMLEGKWKMKDHAPGPGSGSNNANVGATLGRLLNSSNEKIRGDEQNRTIGDVVTGVETEDGEQLDGLVVFDGDTFAQLMAWKNKGYVARILSRLRKKGSNNASRRMDEGKQGTFPQFWYVDGLRNGLDNYSDFTIR